MTLFGLGDPKLLTSAWLSITHGLRLDCLRERLDFLLLGSNKTLKYRNCRVLLRSGNCKNLIHVIMHELQNALAKALASFSQMAVALAKASLASTSESAKRGYLRCVSMAFTTADMTSHP